MDLLFTDESGHFCNDPIIPLYKQKIANFVNFFPLYRKVKKQRGSEKSALHSMNPRKLKVGNFEVVYLHC